MGFKKGFKAGAMLALIAFTFFLSAAGCGTDLKKAFKIQNQIRDLYNTAGPILESLHASGQISDPVYEKLKSADAEINKAFLDSYDALIAVKAGTGTWADYYLAIDTLRGILQRHGLEFQEISQIKGIIDAIIALLPQRPQS